MSARESFLCGPASIENGSPRVSCPARERLSPCQPHSASSPWPASLFGDLGEPPLGWSLKQHTESIAFRGHILRIQTSDHQTDDGTRGTWHFSLRLGAHVMAQTQVPWVDHETLVQLRIEAQRWAESYLDASPTTEVLDALDNDYVAAAALPVSAPDPGAETVREDIASLTEK